MHFCYFVFVVFVVDFFYLGEVNLWPGSMFGIYGLDPRQLTKAEIVTSDHALRLVDFLKRKAPGFEQAWLEYTASQLGVRETRRIVGGFSPTLREALSGDVRRRHRQAIC